VALLQDDASACPVTTDVRVPALNIGYTFLNDNEIVALRHFFGSYTPQMWSLYAYGEVSAGAQKLTSSINRIDRGPEGMVTEGRMASDSLDKVNAIDPVHAEMMNVRGGAWGVRQCGVQGGCGCAV